MAERSKALDSSSSLFGGVGSNPTGTIFFLKKENLNQNKNGEILTEVGFEPTPPKRLVPKTSALDHSAIQSYCAKVISINFVQKYSQ